MKVWTLKKAITRVNDNSKAAREKCPRAITVDGKSFTRFKAIKWQDYAGIGEGIVSDYMKCKQKEIAG